MKRSALSLLAITSLLAAIPALPAYAQDEGNAILQPVVHDPVITRHKDRFNGPALAYSAIVEAIDVADAQGKTSARVVSFSYVADVAKAQAPRPVMFMFNGGPISPSYLVHLGGFGPRRVLFPDDVKADPASFRLIDNPDSPLDHADLVFVDPASTGFSRVAPGKRPEDYFSIDSDAQQVAAFIQAWLKRHGRSGSPVFILGESYGTNRAAAVAAQLTALPDPVQVSGVVLFGQALNIIEYAQRPANIISYSVSLPTLAAIAWYHGKVDRTGHDFDSFIEAARVYARTTYLPALFRGANLPQDERAAVAAQLERFSGIAASWYLQNDLRITKERFRIELLKDQGLLIGRNDARYAEPITERGGAPDPSRIIPEETERLFRQYIRDELKVDWAEPYVTTSPVKGLEAWGWGGSGTTPFSDWPYQASLSPLFEKNPRFRVMVANGYYDTQTTIGAAEYLVTQSGWPSDRTDLRYYQGGHMAYSVDATARRFGADLRSFIAAAR